MPKFPGPTRAAARSAARPMTSLGGGLNFDPTQVKLKASPKPIRKNDGGAASAPVSPIAAMRKNLRPTTMIDASPIKAAAVTSKPSIPERKEPSNEDQPPIKPSAKPPAKPPAKPANVAALGIKAQLASMPVMFPGGPVSPISPSTEEQAPKHEKSESLPTFMLSPRSGAPMETDLTPKRKKRTNKTLTSFLLRRPQKAELIEGGILHREAEAFPELGEKFHSENELPEKKQPALKIGKNCMVVGCSKKVKGKKVRLFACLKYVENLCMPRRIVIDVVMLLARLICTNPRN